MRDSDEERGVLDRAARAAGRTAFVVFADVMSPTYWIQRGYLRLLAIAAFVLLALFGLALWGWANS